jgi:hypothetical protein
MCKAYLHRSDLIPQSQSRGRSAVRRAMVQHLAHLPERVKGHHRRLSIVGYMAGFHQSRIHYLGEFALGSKDADEKSWVSAFVEIEIHDDSCCLTFSPIVHVFAKESDECSPPPPHNGVQVTVTVAITLRDTSSADRPGSEFSRRS